MKAWRQRQSRRTYIVAASLAALAAGLVFTITASGASLTGSNFEVDGVNLAAGTSNANLKQDGAAPAIDWASASVVAPAEVRNQDTASGSSDNSYKGGGSKEDDVCPVAESTGGIPNNKSDLQWFGAYKEAVGTGPGVLNVFWQRVNEPNGTTNMDFEFNKSTTPCGAGSPNVQRSQGDILLQFDVDQGGARAELSKRIWNGNATSGSWSDAVALTATQAIGAINSDSIPFGESDGLITSGSLAPRTFGEASFDLAQVFDPNTCQSFGSAMLKSRSSDSFTSALKDFILPIPLNIQNCASVTIRKVTQPPGETQSFGYTETFNTSPAQAAPGNVFSLTGASPNNSVTFSNVLLASGLTVIEDAPPAGWAFVSLDCSASSVGVPAADRVVDPALRKVTFTLNAASDVLDCTYTNRKLLGAIEVTKSYKHAATPLDTTQAGVSFTVNGETKQTDANGKACFDGLSFGAAGTVYAVLETLPTGYSADGDLSKNVTVNNAATCADSPFGGETVAFGNTPLTDVTITVNSQVAGGTMSTIDCEASTEADGLDKASDTTTGDIASNTVLGLEPQTLNCEIVIDP